jgi:hypothetical protein
MLDLPGIVRAVQAALPEAAPFAVVPMLKAQIPHVDVPAGIALLDQIVTHIPAAAWDFTDAALDRWPEPVGQHALACSRALPPGLERIKALCSIARRLTLAEQREALDGILDRTLPDATYEHTKPLSYRHVITNFLRTLPEAWQEEWIATEATDFLQEALARRDLGLFTEVAVRKMWSQIDHAATPSRDIPQDYLFVAEHLPPDLKGLALARIRASMSQDSRLYHLVYFDGELTDAERYEVVEVPLNEHTRHNPRSQAEHLRRVMTHLPKVPVELRQRWLQRVLTFTEDGSLQCGLMALLPSLSGKDYRQAADALVASVIRKGQFYTSEKRWNLLPDDALGLLLLRQRKDPYGWHRDAIIAHLVKERDPALADRCLRPLLDGLSDLDADHCIETVDAMTPWLAARSDNAVPRALAALPVPVPRRRANPLYVIERVLAQVEDELAD